LSVDAEHAQAAPRGGAGGRALAAIALTVAALSLAAGSSPALLSALSPAAASDAAVVTRPTAPAAAAQTLPETGSSLMAPLSVAGTIRAARASFTNTPASETISLVNGSGAQAYPIVNYEYAIVSTAQTSAVRAQDLRAFFSWAITSGAAQLARVNFQPLPSSVVTLSGAQIAKIKADT
jgi:ABC-type phosphate transport system substrate-binding protein